MIHFSESLNALILEGDNDTWVFEPQSGITPAQLALCLAPLLTGRAELVAALHPLAQQHFRRSERIPRDAPERLNVPMPDAAMGAPAARLEELAAVVGKSVSATEWVSVADVVFNDPVYEFALCIRLKQKS